jgi:serine/threonine protein kinase
VIASRAQGALAQRVLESGLLRAGFGDIAPIGVGSLATVYRARELATNRFVALKVLDIAVVSARAQESFERESLVLGALSSHPNVNTFYRTFVLPDGRPVLVLELCNGSVAERQLSHERISLQEAVAIAIKIAGALETAHRGGVLHCDVKPQNVLMTEFGEPALADFGVAKLQSSTQLTAGLFDFTSLHVAPELLEGGPTSAATDVYELASMLYELVAGSAAFRAYAGEPPASVVLRLLRDPVRPVVSETVPLGLSDLLVWSMAKELRNRPPSMEFFAFELDRIEAAQGWPRTAFLVRDIDAAVGAPRARSAAARRLTLVRPAAAMPSPAHPIAAP